MCLPIALKSGAHQRACYTNKLFDVEVIVHLIIVIRHSSVWLVNDTYITVNGLIRIKANESFIPPRVRSPNLTGKQLNASTSVVVSY